MCMSVCVCWGGGVLEPPFLCLGSFIRQCWVFELRGFFSLTDLLVIFKRLQQNCCIAYLTAY